MIRKIAKTRTIAIIAGILSLLILAALLTFIYMNTSDGNDCYIGGKKLIVVGSEQFKPEIEPYSICLVQEVTKDNRKSIKEGDIVIYSTFLNETRAKVCCKVLEERPNNWLFVGSNDKNKGNIVPRSGIESKVIKPFNSTAGIAKVLFSRTGLITVITALTLIVLYGITATICHCIAKP